MIIQLIPVYATKIQFNFNQNKLTENFWLPIQRRGRLSNIIKAFKGSMTEAENRSHAINGRLLFLQNKGFKVGGCQPQGGGAGVIKFNIVY